MIATMPSKTGFGPRLRALRTAAGLTQVELASLAGIHHHSLTKLEAGERDPNWATVLALAAALKCEPNDFVAPPEPPPPAASKPRRRKP
jgi:transcriptional regulator with XRE-family HTH domain